MNNYYLMNKILEEEGTCERSQEEEALYAEHLADVAISKMEDEGEEIEHIYWETLGEKYDGRN